MYQNLTRCIFNSFWAYFSCAGILASPNNQLVYSVYGFVLIHNIMQNRWYVIVWLMLTIASTHLNYDIISSTLQLGQDVCAICRFPNTTIWQLWPQIQVAWVSCHARVTVLLYSALKRRRYKCFLKHHISRSTGNIKVGTYIMPRRLTTVVIDT